MAMRNGRREEEHGIILLKWRGTSRGGKRMEVLKERKEFDLKAMMTSEFPEVQLEHAKPFAELMMQYRCALMEVETKLNVLNAEFTMKNNRNPFESIKSRIKSPVSILEKMQRKGYPISAESIEENLADIAGIRVICSFPDDIYATAKLLTQQDDITVLEVKDYIKNPKDNGYRSLHLILEIPIFLSEQKKNMKVEVQFRTIAMDFWASLEHRMHYKKNLDVKMQEMLVAELRDCAEESANLDIRMETVKDYIEENTEKSQKYS